MKKDMIEIVEYWDKTKPLYEKMFKPEYDKKKAGEPYTTIYSSSEVPWEEVGFENTSFIEIKQYMTFEEAKNRFGFKEEN